MTSESMDLARRAVACKGWRWVEGMAVAKDGRRIRVCVDSLGKTYFPGRHRFEDLTPDLTDPATLGCLLALVREAWKSPVAQASPSLPDGHLWTCYINDEAEDRFFRENTEAEALVAALEAAPL